MKYLNKHGFTLGELLATIVIITILCNVTFVAVGSYVKSLKLMEEDGIAKELFIVAQNHLCLAKASGELYRLNESMRGNELSASPSYAENDDGEYYYLIHHAGEDESLQTVERNIYDMILPAASIDETVRTSGNYVVVYEYKTASVVAVLYSGATNIFRSGQSISLDESDARNIDEIYAEPEKRKNYKNGNVVGCYTDKAMVYGSLPLTELDS